MNAHNTAPTQFVEADGIRFAYRRFGNPTGTPIVLLQHFMGNLDNYDPAITTPSRRAARRSRARARRSLRLLDGRLRRQQIAVDRPELIRRLILVVTGPRGGDGMASSPLTSHRCSGTATRWRCSRPRQP